MDSTESSIPEKSNRKSKTKSVYTYKERLVTAFFSVFAFVFVVIIFGPTDIYANNKAEMLFAFKDFAPWIFALAAIVQIVLTFYFAAMRSGVFNLVTAVIMILPVGGCLQALLFGSAGAITGDKTSVSPAKSALIIAFWVIISAGLIAASFIRKKQWKKIVIFVSILLFGMNGVTLVTDFVQKGAAEDRGTIYDCVLTEDNLLTLSKDENVVFIVVDRLDNSFVDKTFKSNPKLKSKFESSLEGFTYFTGATSLYGRTFPSVPYMLSAVEYPEGESASDYLKTVYQKSDFLSDLKKNDYSVNIFTKGYYGYADGNSLLGIADNVAQATGYNVSKYVAGNYLLGLSLARYIPANLTRPYYYLTDSLLPESVKFECGGSKVYSCDDALLYSELCEKRLTFNEGSDKGYTFIHLQGAHTPLTLTADCKRSDSETSAVEQVSGVMTLVMEYIEQMKQLGVYDNSTIIISADHGYAFRDEAVNIVDKATSALFIKPKNAANEQMKYSAAQVSHTNLFATIVNDSSIETDNDYGESVFDIGENEIRQRKYYKSVKVMPKRTLMTSEYIIEGNANDVKNWKYIKTVDNKTKWY